MPVQERPLRPSFNTVCLVLDHDLLPLNHPLFSMKALISLFSLLRRTAMLVAFSMLVLVLSGCEVTPLNDNTTKSKAHKPMMTDDISRRYMLGWPEEETEPLREPLKMVKEIPAGNPGEGTIVKTTTVTPVRGQKSQVDVRYEYPNGYVSVGEKLDPEWRKKRPKKTSGQSVDYFNFSGQSGAGGTTSGSAIKPSF